MSNGDQVFVADGGATRKAQPEETRAGLRAAWADCCKRFQETWPRAGHKLVFVIQEGAGGLTNEDANDVLTEINLLEKSHPVDLILHTPGGAAFASERIADALVSRRNTASFVPFYAMSAGTEIALATQRIFLGPGANLGPYDLYFNGVSARDVVAMAKKLGDKAPLGLQIEAQEAEKALQDEAKKTCARINRRHKGFLGLRGCELAKKLTTGDLYHGERILYGHARRLGIRAYKGVPKSLYDLISVRREQLRKLRELEDQLTLVQQQAMPGVRELSARHCGRTAAAA